MAMPQPGSFFDSVQRMLRRSAEHGENSRVAQMGYAVIAPLPGSDHSAVQRQDYAQFLAVEGDLLGQPGRGGKRTWRLDRHNGQIDGKPRQYQARTGISIAGPRAPPAMANACKCARFAGGSRQTRFSGRTANDHAARLGVSPLSNLRIRKASPQGHAAIWSILRPIFRAGDTYAVDPEITEADALAYWLAERAYVAEFDGRIIGTYYLKTNQQGGGSHVCNCGYATHPDERGRGAASAMLAHSLDEATRAGYRAMQFNFVLATNAGAIRLWRRAGFEEAGRLRDAFRHPAQGYVDALIMMKRLDGKTAAGAPNRPASASGNGR